MEKPKLKSDYVVLPREKCKRPNKNTGCDNLLKKINQLKVCLSQDVVRSSDIKGREFLDYLQENRLILRMTLREFELLVPFSSKYKNVTDRSNGKRIVVSTIVWTEKVSFGGLTEKEANEKIDEQIQAIENSHMYEFVKDSYGFLEKKKVNFNLITGKFQ